jgi:D-tyrosyl-tRNA(Tyr) deacylase
MKAVLTRVSSASVVSQGALLGENRKRVLILLGVGPADDDRHAVKLADKICTLRVFTDENDKMNLSLEQGGRRAACGQQLYPVWQLRQGQAAGFFPRGGAVDGRKAV